MPVEKTNRNEPENKATDLTENTGQQKFPAGYRLDRQSAATGLAGTHFHPPLFQSPDPSRPVARVRPYDDSRSTAESLDFASFDRLFLKEI